MGQGWCFRDVCFRVIIPMGLLLCLVYAFGAISCGEVFFEYSRPKEPVTTAEPAPQPDMRSPVRISLSNSIAVTGFADSGVFVMSAPGLVQSVAFWHDGGPLGIAWGPEGLFIGNATSGAIDIYSPDGMFVREFTLAAGRPSDLAYDASAGLLFSVDSLGHSVKVFGPSGALMNTIPASGQPGLYSPTAIALDDALSEVYVSDYGNSISTIPARVSAYGYDGMFRYSIISGSAGAGYQFSRPQGLHANGAGLVYMADSVLGKVLVFSTATKLGVASYGTFGTGPGKLFLPLDIALDASTGKLYVTDNRDGVIEVFDTP